MIGVLPFVIILAITPQEIEKGLKLLEEGRYEELRSVLPLLLKRYPHEPALLYLQGMMQKDGQKAVKLFEALLEKYPHCEYADDALFRIGQYYFAKGYYISAEKRFELLSDQYPQSPLLEEAMYLSALCSLSIGDESSAKSKLRDLVKRFPGSKYATLALKDLGLSKAPSEVKRYTLQVGAFINYINAIEMKRLFQSQGYDAEIQVKVKQGRVFYLVWVGQFDTTEQAKEVGRWLKEKFGTEYKVVRRF